MNHFRPHRPSPAMVVALLALFVAMGGVGYAAFKLPNNSVGSKQIKKDAVNSSKVKEASLLAGDFKAGQLPAGAQGIQGLKGDKGDPCPASDANCKGPKGERGAQGPGALSFDGQFPLDNDYHLIATVNGLDVNISCETGSSGRMAIQVIKSDLNTSFFAWGTVLKDADTTYAPAPVDVGSGQFIEVFQTAGNRLELDLVAHATASGDAVKWTRVSILGIKGNFCNYHALIIPPSS